MYKKIFFIAVLVLVVAAIFFPKTDKATLASCGITTITSGQSYDGWAISYPQGYGVTWQVDTCNTTSSNLALYNAVTYSAEQGELSTFTQTSSTAATTITLEEQDITNSTGDTWSGFATLFLQGFYSAQNPAIAFAGPTFTSVSPFTSSAFVQNSGEGNANTQLTYSGTMTNGQTGTWGVNGGGGSVVISTPLSTGAYDQSFTFKEIPFVGQSGGSSPTGEAEIQNVGSNGSTGTAPNGAQSYVTGFSPTATNPAFFQNIAINGTSTSLTAYASYISGYTPMAGSCTYALGGSECVVSSFPTTPTCSNSWCAVPVTVTADTITKTAFQYVANPTGNVEIKTVGANSTTGSVPTGVQSYVTGFSPTSNDPAYFSGISSSQSTSNGAYVGSDTTTSGSWPGKYGADGYDIQDYSSNLPSYAQVSVSGSGYEWNGNTSDSRALQTTSPGTGIAACWYGSTYTINIDITDGKTHQVALYALDWDGGGNRSQTYAVENAATGQLISSKSISSFQNGIYSIWDISGNINIVVTDTGGANAVVSGIFFDPTTNTLSSASNETAYVSNVSGYTPSVNTCTYPISGSECSVSTFPDSLTCSGSWCSFPLTVTSNTVTKMAVQYISQYSTTPTATLEIQSIGLPSNQVESYTPGFSPTTTNPAFFSPVPISGAQ